MKTLVFAIAALFVMPVAAHAMKKPVSSAKPRDFGKKQKKVSSAKPKNFDKNKPVSSAKPLVLNHSLSGEPFYSTERVFSMH